ncbi:MAG: hypothetical protein JWO18_311 [Microbacteriaceae bacterium]|jgi:hypothetical protein|nr:hypothetical protein [Microbacteriaceae bacterium]
MGNNNYDTEQQKFDRHVRTEETTSFKFTGQLPGICAFSRESWGAEIKKHPTQMGLAPAATDAG